MRFSLVLVPPRRVTQDVGNYIRIPPTLTQRYGGEMIALFAAKVSTIAVPLEGAPPPSSP